MAQNHCCCGGLQVRARWLLEWVAKCGGGPDVATAVARILLLGGSADEVAAELFELMGDGSFDAIQELLDVR